jgi:hypothetical protein
MPLQGKANFHILRPTGKFTLGYHALIAYSFLVRRSRVNLPTSQRDLVALTGCSHHTLTKVEDRLAAHELVVRDGYNLLPQADASGLFHVKSKEAKRWEDRYQTTIIYDLAADSPLTAIENHILCSILSFNANGKFPTTSAITQLLCLSERTVKDKVKRLRKLGLIDGLCATIKDEDYWLDAPPKARKPDLINEDVAEEVANQFLAAFPRAYEPQFISSLADWEVLMHGHAIKMLRANFADDDVGHFWENVQEWGGMNSRVIEKFAVQVFANLFKLAEYHTSLNRRKGYRGKNSCGLLNLWTKAICIDLLARYSYLGTDGFVDYMPDLEKVRFKVAG